MFSFFFLHRLLVEIYVYQSLEMGILRAYQTEDMDYSVNDLTDIMVNEAS